MSKFNKYAKELDSIAREYFAEYQKAKAEYEEAEALYKANRRPLGAWKAEPNEVARVAGIEARYYEAKSKMERVVVPLAEQINDRIADLRAALIEDMSKTFTVDTDAVNSTTVALLSSGMLTAKDYEAIMEKAHTENNFTMVRLIAAHAKKAAADAGDISNMPSEKRAEVVRLLNVAGSAEVEKIKTEDFDSAADIFRRSMRNDVLQRQWASYTEKFVREF